MKFHHQINQDSAFNKNYLQMKQATILDSVNYIQKLSLFKIFNLIKLLLSYRISRMLKKPVVWGLPASISIEPTTSCNLRCPECPSGLRSFSRNTGMLSLSDFKNWMDQVHQHITYLTLYFQGEPYLNKDFFEFAKYARKQKIYSSTSTNAHFLTDENARKTVESGLDRLIISIDGIDQESYQNYRIGGKLSKVMEGTTNILKWKKELKSNTPYVIFQFLVVKPNEHQVEAVKELGKKVGVGKVAIKTAQVYDYANGHSLIPENDEYSRYKKGTDGKYALKNKLLNQCWRMWQSSVITWDGRVVPCCFDKDATHKMGELKEKSFKEIWKGSAYSNFRRSLLISRSEIDICKNCTEGTKVWAGD